MIVPVVKLFGAVLQQDTLRSEVVLRYNVPARLGKGLFRAKNNYLDHLGAEQTYFLFDKY